MTVHQIPNTSTSKSFWMPFTANRQFKETPRLFSSAEGMHYTTVDGRKVIDGSAGLWCVNAGHGRKQIAAAVERQLMTLDFAPSFQMGHPLAFDFAERLAEIAPKGLDRIFFTNSGSESVDTALKIALAYHRANGQATPHPPDRPRARLSRRRLRRHVGRRHGQQPPRLRDPSAGRRSHPPHPRSRPQRLLQGPAGAWRRARRRSRAAGGLHGAETIAAVIVEPVPGSTGVLPPPKGYLQRLREICDKHGILLIFDEVITGFGRLGTPFAADFFGVTPDLMTTAKGITNGTIPWARCSRAARCTTA